MDKRDELIAKQLELLLKYEATCQRATDNLLLALAQRDEARERAEKAENELARIRGWGN